MTDEIVDVAGQPGGPHPDVQALVDAEQRELIAQIRAARAPGEAEEARLRDERLQRALDGQSEHQSLVERIKQLEAKIAVLERP